MLTEGGEGSSKPNPKRRKTHAIKKVILLVLGELLLLCPSELLHTSDQNLHANLEQVFADESNAGGASRLMRNIRFMNDHSVGASSSISSEILKGCHVEEGESFGAIYVPQSSRTMHGRLADVVSRDDEALAQADKLQTFENLQDDYSALAKTHKECSKTVKKLVTVRLDLEHNAKLYTNVSNHFKELKEEHSGCGGKIKTLEKEKD
nr:hypothetical protein [Tanacetum cinerariifolium]